MLKLTWNRRLFMNTLEMFKVNKGKVRLPLLTLHISRVFMNNLRFQVACIDKDVVLYAAANSVREWCGGIRVHNYTVCARV